MSKQKPAEGKDDKMKILEAVVDEIKGRFGDGAIMKLGEAKHVDVDAIPTGSISLDLALGVGGLPMGRIIEIFGLESSGKSTLALHAIAEVQKRGGLAAFIDAEHALDPEYAKKIGVQVNDLFISQPDTGEQALEIVESLVKSGVVDLVVVDSVAALTPRVEIEGEMGQQHIGLQARLMSQACLVEDTELIDPLSGKISTIKEIVQEKLPWHSLTYNEKRGKFITSEIIDWLAQGEKECLEIKTKDGHILKLTDDHLVLTLNGWKQVKDLTNQDCLAIPRKIPEPAITLTREKLTDEEIKIIAYILGDGNFTTSNYNLSFTNINSEILSDLNDSLGKLNCELVQGSDKDYRISKKKYLPLGSYRSPVKEMLKREGIFGKKSPQKDVPPTIFQLSNRQVALFISRIWSCDGHIDSSARAIIYSSSSLKLIKQLQFLLLRFGIVSRWSQKRPLPHVLYKLIIQGRKNIQIFTGKIGLVGIGIKKEKLKELVGREWKSKNMPFQDVFPYQLVPKVKEAVYLAGHTGQDISHLFGLFNRTSFPEFKSGRLRLSRKHLEKISDFIGNKELQKLAQEEIYWSNIDSISSIGKRAVYDLTIKDRPNFVANGVVVHNCRKLTALTAKSGTAIVFINQIRIKIGVMFGNPEDTPGGKALKFYSSVRLELRRAAKIQQGDQIIGNRIKAKVVKNKVAPPFRQAEFDIFWNEGISRLADIINTGLKFGVVSRKGAWFNYGEENLGQGLEASKNHLKENPRLVTEIVKGIKKAVAIQEQG